MRNHVRQVGAMIRSRTVVGRLEPQGRHPGRAAVGAEAHAVLDGVGVKALVGALGVGILVQEAILLEGGDCPPEGGDAVVCGGSRVMLAHLPERSTPFRVASGEGGPAVS